MLIFIAWDGDHIGRQVGRASLADDVEGLRRISQGIDLGNNVWRSWVESTGGNLISMGGDEGRAEVAADRLDELPAIRQQYQEAVGSTVSVGIGMKLSEADKALIGAKLKGGDQILFFTEEVNQLVAEAAAKGQQTEEQKISDEYLNKAAPGMNAGAFTGATRPSAPSVSKPTATQGDHEEAQNLYDLMDSDDRPAPPEQTHAAADFEKQLHDEAWKGEEEDMHADSKKSANLDQIKQQIIQAIQVLKAQAPVLEQVKQVAPQAYQAMMGLSQAVIGMAKELLPQQPMQKAEGLSKSEDKVEKTMSDVRDHHAQARGDADAKHCASGHCYEQVEAMHHLLGGSESGWQPHHLFHEGAGPHWFLKHQGGRIVDPLAHTFSQALPYDEGRPSTFLTKEPSKGAQAVIDSINGGLAKDEMMKGKLPMPKASAHHEVTLPVGSAVNNKIKVQHNDGKTSWKQVESGQIRSMDPAGHPTSSRSPNSR